MADRLEDPKIGYYGSCKAADLEIKKFKEKSAYVVSDWPSIPFRTDGQQFKWKHDLTLAEHTLYVRQILGWGTEPSEVKFHTESGGERSFGTFAKIPPHFYIKDCFLKFEEDVTFSLCGPGPAEIFIYEIKKPKEESWWKGAKKFFNKYTWKANYSDLSKDKQD